MTGFDTADCVPFWDNELLDPDFNKFNDLARSIDPIATLFEATDDELSRSPRFQKFYVAAHASDELRIAFTSGTSCHAIGAFIRCDGEAYTPTEVNDARNLVALANTVLRQALGQMGAPLVSGGPVVVLLGPDGEVFSMSEARPTSSTTSASRSTAARCRARSWWRRPRPGRAGSPPACGPETAVGCASTWPRWRATTPCR